MSRTRVMKSEDLKERFIVSVSRSGLKVNIEGADEFDEVSLKGKRLDIQSFNGVWARNWEDILRFCLSYGEDSLLAVGYRSSLRAFEALPDDVFVALHDKANASLVRFFDTEDAEERFYWDAAKGVLRLLDIKDDASSSAILESSGDGLDVYRYFLIDIERMDDVDYRLSDVPVRSFARHCVDSLGSYPSLLSGDLERSLGDFVASRFRLDATHVPLGYVVPEGYAVSLCDRFFRENAELIVLQELPRTFGGIDVFSWSIEHEEVEGERIALVDALEIIDTGVPGIKTQLDAMSFHAIKTGIEAHRLKRLSGSRSPEPEGSLGL